MKECVVYVQTYYLALVADVEQVSAGGHQFAYGFTSGQIVDFCGNGVVAVLPVYFVGGVYVIQVCTVGAGSKNFARHIENACVMWYAPQSIVGEHQCEALASFCAYDVVAILWNFTAQCDRNEVVQVFAQNYVAAINEIVCLADFVVYMGREFERHYFKCCSVRGVNIQFVV